LKEKVTFLFNLFFQKSNIFTEDNEKYKGKKYEKIHSRFIYLWWLIKKLEEWEILKCAIYLYVFVHMYS